MRDILGNDLSDAPRFVFATGNRVPYHMDFRGHAGVPSNRIFYQSGAVDEGYVTLVAEGYGAENAYGSGSIFVRARDLPEPLDTKKETSPMNYTQKLQALTALSPLTSMYVNMQGVWHVGVPGVEIKKGGTLAGLHSWGATPEAAIEATWEAATDLRPDYYLVVNATGPNRRAVRWNGFMWANVDEPHGELA